MSKRNLKPNLLRNSQISGWPVVTPAHINSDRRFLPYFPTLLTATKWRFPPPLPAPEALATFTCSKIHSGGRAYSLKRALLVCAYMRWTQASVPSKVCHTPTASRPIMMHALSIVEICRDFSTYYISTFLFVHVLAAKPAFCKLPTAQVCPVRTQYMAVRTWA